MRKAHFYDLATGFFSGGSVSSDVFENFEKLAAGACPPNHHWIEGVTDHQSQRVNLATKQIEDHRPARPSPDHDWDEASKRWLVRQSIARARTQRANMLSQIAILESQQHRAVRDFTLTGDKTRLQAIDDQIVAIRNALPPDA